jgi:hypothetical protein
VLGINTRREGSAPGAEYDVAQLRRAPVAIELLTARAATQRAFTRAFERKRPRLIVGR